MCYPGLLYKVLSPQTQPITSFVEPARPLQQQSDYLKIVIDRKKTFDDRTSQESRQRSEDLNIPAATTIQIPLTVKNEAIPLQSVSQALPTLVPINEEFEEFCRWSRTSLSGE